ncbi:alpha-beta plait domain-containing protein, partial [Cymbomonas tetramitiformis]
MSRYAQGPPDVSNTYSLLVLNITFRTTPEDLRPIFDRYGKVQDVYIPKDRATGDSRGFAFVRYAHEADAEMAVERINGRNIDGRDIVVQFAKYGRSEENKGPPRRQENDRDRDYRRDDGRRDSHRRDRDDYRRDEPRRDEYRRDDHRREDSRRGDSRREERRYVLCIACPTAHAT